MGTERFYKAGSFYRICDRTGFAIRAESTQKEWQNLIVDRRVYERRQPQDFVKGIADNQTVPDPRPRSPNPAVGTRSPEFEVQSHSIMVTSGQFYVYGVWSGVNAANFPSGF